MNKKYTMDKYSHNLLFAALLSLSQLAGAYGNGSSFTAAQDSSVDYRHSPHRPVIECSELQALTEFSVSIISASLITRNGHLPEYCLVYGIIVPEIEFIVQLPSNWNGRLYVHGNGGDAGESVHGEFGKSVREAALRNGFIATFNNSGHDRKSFSGTRWAYNSLQREIDYSFRAVHLNTIAVKQISRIYYGKKPVYSYFDGCSTGGGQAFKEAQRFPDDFDGILAGAPVSDPFALLLYIWNNQHAQELMQFNAKRVEFLGKIIMTKFDDMDGVKDGVISNPAIINFQPARDLPKDPSGEHGFTDAEIKGLNMAYGGLFHKGQQLVDGIPVGAELAGQTYIQNSFTPATRASAWVSRLIPDNHGNIIMRTVMQDWFRYLLLDKDDPKLDWRKIELTNALHKMKARRPLLAATNANLHKFKARGGKLLIYNGWGDVGVNPYFVLNYYKNLQKVFGNETDQFTRLFLIPGMFHCRGGLNVDRFDGMTALINWVEKNIAPDYIMASRIENGNVVRTRPLCPYPEVATYDGKGNINQAASFTCQ